MDRPITFWDTERRQQQASRARFGRLSENLRLHHEEHEHGKKAHWPHEFAFHKDASFSTPIQEYTKGAIKDL